MKQIFLLLAFLGAGFSLQAQTQTAAQTGADIATLTADENKGPNEAKDTDINLLKAALKGWHVRVGAGVSIGGSAPLPIPAEIRKIDSYNPTLCIQLEGDAHKKFGKHWGMMVGVRFENKGMETDATVKNYHMEAVNVDGSGKIIGAFTGKVNTEVDLNYLTFPILATYSFNNRWLANCCRTLPFVDDEGRIYGKGFRWLHPRPEPYGYEDRSNDGYLRLFAQLAPLSVGLAGGR